MPIYLMKCDACGVEYEDFRRVGDVEECGRCVSCGAPKLSRTEVLVEDCCGCEVSVPLDSSWREREPGCGCC